jgi:5-methylcytosine-specific restriction endonuclease McrA
MFASEKYRRKMSKSVRKAWENRPGPMTGRNGKSNPNWKGGRFVTCHKCGKQFWKSPSQLNTMYHFCSRICVGTQSSERSIKSRQKKGINPYTSYWLTISSQVRKRDNHECQICGTRYKKYKLPVHHVKPISQFDDPIDAHYLNNLVTLCRKCHKRVEIGALPLPQEIIERSEHIDKRQS